MSDRRKRPWVKMLDSSDPLTRGLGEFCRALAAYRLPFIDRRKLRRLRRKGQRLGPQAPYPLEVAP